MSADNPPSYEERAITEATGEASSTGEQGDVSHDLISFSSTVPSLGPAPTVSLPGAALPPGCPTPTAPPPGWMIPETAEDRAAAKEKEACASSSSEKQGLYPTLNGEKECSSSMQPTASAPTVACPVGLEGLQNQAVLLLRENFVPSHRGGTRRSALVVSGESQANLLMVQRGPRGPHRHTRTLEILDGAGGSVVAILESTKRLDVLSVEVQCPPGCRVSRAEVRPGSTPPQLAATLLSADEKPVIHVELPPIGELETQPTLQLRSATNSEADVKGTLQWSWSTEGDLLQAEISHSVDLDVRIKAALLALALLCMEAFSRRWSSSGSSGSTHGRLHLHGHKRRHRHR